MKAICFQNPGMIDLSAVRTMGVSVKESDSPVGYFGTGLKFAVATILRGRGTIELWRGLDKHEIGTKSQSIRGRAFRVVTLDGDELGFTDQLGRNWEPWMAYRELACNATDEGGHVGTDLEPKEGTTLLSVLSDDITKAHKDRRDFMIGPEADPIYTDGKCEAYRAIYAQDFIFYRGIRVSSFPCASKFRYNNLGEIDLTEDRTSRYEFQIKDPIAAMWLQCENKSLLSEVLTADENSLEFNLDWETCGKKPGQAWLEVLAEVARSNHRISPIAEKTYERHTKQSAVLPSESMELRPDQDTALSEAITMLARAGYQVDEYPILVTDRLGAGILGRAAGGRIYLSRDALTKGDATLAGTLLEEWLHLSHGYKDCCRAMQNWLFDALIDQAKRAEFAENERRAQT